MLALSTVCEEGAYTFENNDLISDQSIVLAP
jgi:hypothetical protein